MQNLKKNWLVVWKMTWRIWQIFARALESLKIGTLVGSFNPKKKKYKLKVHRGVISQDNEEWCKILREIDWPFLIPHEEFDKFWPEHLKVSKMFILMCSFWEKYILFELEKYRGVIFYETKKGYKIWREIDLSFQNWLEKFDKFWPEHSQVSKGFTLMGSFGAKYILFQLKTYRGVIFHEIGEGYKIWRGIHLSC